MHLGSPLSTLTGHLDAAVIRVLARTHTTLNGRQIHRLAGVGSPFGINSALSRLVSGGLATASIKPHATLYRLNRDHILWPTVEAALGALAELRSRIQRYAAEHGPAEVTVILFGSVARGDATSDSDVDLLVIVPDDTTNEESDSFIYELSERVRMWTGNIAQIIGMTCTEFRESSGREDALVDEWLTEGEVLIGNAIPGHE